MGRVESTINGYDPIDRNPQPNRVTIIETASVFVVLIVRFLQGYWPLGQLKPVAKCPGGTVRS